MTLLLNGSPKAQGGNSAAVIRLLEPLLDGPCRKSNARKPGEEAYRALCAADTVVLVFPLYVDALPSHLLRFLLGLEEYVRKIRPERLPRFYAVAQCGFYEGRQNRYALEMLEHFCARAGFPWCGGVGLGGGGMLEEGMKPALRPLEETLSRLAEALREARALPENQFACLSIPRWTYVLGGNLSWVLGAGKNGLKRKALYKIL